MKYFSTVAGAVLSLALLSPDSGIAGTEGAMNGEVELVRDHRPVASVVIAKGASTEVRRSAEKLVEIIRESTGALLPILTARADGAAIYVGLHSDLPEAASWLGGLEADGFLIRSDGNGWVIILGGSDRGTSNGVYGFLERYLDVRWLMPGPLGVDLPRAGNLKVRKENHREEPVFLSRSLGPLHYGDPAAQEWDRANRLHKRVDSSHGMRRLFPVGQFGKSNPEFYPLIDGKRLIPPPRPRFKGDRAHYLWQPNFTALGIVEAAAEQIDRFFQENPEDESFPLGLNDGNDRFDQGPESLKRRPGRKNSMRYNDVSDDYFLWANAVTAKVAEKYPGKWMGTLAYREITDPPSPEVGVHPRIVPFLTQDRHRWIDARLKEEDQKRTRQWASQAQALGWYDYEYGASYQVPRIFPHTIAEALKWAARNGVKFYVAELYPNWAEGPKPWLLTRLLWNPEQDVNALLGEWYARAAGEAAAPKLAEFYALWEDLWTKRILESPWWHDRGPYLSYYDRRYLAAVPPAWIARCDLLLDEAVELADSELRKARVGFIRDMWRNWYRPNIILYQAEHLSVPAITTEQEALNELERVGGIIAVAAEFREVLKNWGKNRSEAVAPFYSEPEVKNVGSLFWKVKERSAQFNFDGTALLWRLRPWLLKSPRVSVAMGRLTESDNPTVRETARIVLASVSGESQQVLGNFSFEKEVTPWNVEIDVSPFPSDYPFNDRAGSPSEAVVLSAEKVRTGDSSLKISARREPGKTDVAKSVTLWQEIPYQAGSYYAELFCYAEKSAPKTGGHLTFEAVGADGKVLSAKFPTASIAVGSGEWRENTQSFILPNLPGAARVRVKVVFRMLTPLGDFDARQKLYLDDFSVHYLEVDR